FLKRCPSVILRPCMIGTNVLIGFMIPSLFLESLVYTLLNDEVPDACGNDVKQSQRNKDLPAQMHQLVVAVPGYCCTKPHAEENQEINLGHEVDRAKQGNGGCQRAVPAAQEQGGGYGAHGN